MFCVFPRLNTHHSARCLLVLCDQWTTQQISCFINACVVWYTYCTYMSENIDEWKRRCCLAPGVGPGVGGAGTTHWFQSAKPRQFQLGYCQLKKVVDSRVEKSEVDRNVPFMKDLGTRKVEEFLSASQRLGIKTSHFLGLTRFRTRLTGNTFLSTCTWARPRFFFFFPRWQQWCWQQQYKFTISAFFSEPCLRAVGRLLVLPVSAVRVTHILFFFFSFFFFLSFFHFLDALDFPRLTVQLCTLIF